MLIDRRKHNANTFRPVVSIANTDSRLSDALIEKTGITRVYVHRRRGPRNRRQYTWRMSAEDLKTWLPIVIPWLVLKKRQAELLLEYLTVAETNRSRKGKPFNTKARDPRYKETIHAEIRRLNLRAQADPKD